MNINNIIRFSFHFHETMGNKECKRRYDKNTERYKNRINIEWEINLIDL
jgi:hypothetical protein